MFRISWALSKPPLGHNAPALLPPGASKIPPRYATSALTYFMGQALNFAFVKFHFLMSRFAILLAALIAAVSLQARTIKGTVLSDADSTAVVGAACKLMSGQQLVQGVVSDAQGVFVFSTSAKGKLALEITMVGFSPTEIVIDKDGNVDVGTVYLSEGVTLGEVQVTAQSMVDIKGRTVVFPSAADVKASSTALSLFQKLPLAGLQANPINRTLSVDGGTPVILINGIPSTISDVNALAAKDIAKIEFSRLTPARYADQGYTGMLSITLKKRSDGGQVYLWSRSALNTAFMDGNFRASYHQGPSQFTLAYNPSWRNYQQVYDRTEESLIAPDFRVDMLETDRNPFNYHTHSTQLRYDFSPNLQTLFSATFRMTPQSNSSRAIAHTDDSFLGQYDNRNLSSSRDLTPSLDLYFKREFNDANSLEVQVVGTLSSSDYRRSNDYAFPDGSTDIYVMDVDSRRRSLISEVSYTHDFGSRTSLSAGFQNTLSHATNTYINSDYKPLLTENNNYLYASLGHQVGKFYLSLSSGAKMYWMKNDLNRRHFIRNITTVQANWNMSQAWSLVGAFQYSPGIPSLTALTDYPQQLTPYLVKNGNPDLKVSQNFIYQLMPAYKYKKFNASLLMTVYDGKDFVMEDIVYAGDHLFLSQSINARRWWRAGGNLYLRVSDIHGFGANVSLGLTHYEALSTDWTHHLTAFNASFSLWWNHGPYTISYWRKVPGKYLNGDVVSKDENGDEIEFEYKPNKHWTIGAAWMYMFERRGTKYPYWRYSNVNLVYRDRYIKNNANMVVLSVSYSADFGSIFRSSRRSLNNSDRGSSLLKM